jgi:hypothetical protein
MNNGPGQFNSTTEWAMVNQAENAELPPVFFWARLKPEWDRQKIPRWIGLSEARSEKADPFSALVGQQHAGALDFFSIQ